MFNLFKSEKASVGSVLFRGNLPPRAEEFDFLRSLGVEIEKENRPEMHWALKLRHRTWGDAELMCIRNNPLPGGPVIDCSVGLSDEEREEAKAGGTSVTIRCPAARRNVLHDRKNFFRYLLAVMGDDAVIAVDIASLRFWSRASLQEELAHDADLDISSLYSVHAVVPDEQAAGTWVHTHGLAELGAFDFDIIDASDDALGSMDDLVRAMAFSIVEDLVKHDTPAYQWAYPRPIVRLVPAADFDRLAPAAERVVREGADHTDKRSVVCEPAKGVFGRFSKSVKAARFFKDWDGSDLAINFSAAATELMADRARQTLGVLRSLLDEFGDLDLPSLAKMGYPSDSGAGVEHLWFNIHGVQDGEIDATLASQPFHIASMKPGDRARHSIERLTDWTVMTPVAAINPRSLWPARVIRANRDEIRNIMNEMKKSAE